MKHRQPKKRMNLKDMPTCELQDDAPRDWDRPSYGELEKRIVTRNSIILALSAAVVILGGSLLVMMRIATP